MLYKLKQADDKTTFVRLNATSMHDQGLLESQMEQWLADNPTAVLPENEARVLVISQEAPFKNVTDILAIDAQGNLLIIEVKRGQSPRDVIAQALEYASDVADWNYDRLNKTAIQYFTRRSLGFKSLLDAYSETFSVSPEDCSESLFNQQQRLFVVGEQIDDKLQRTARWLLKRGVSITCLSYICYLSDDQSREFFLDINEEVGPIELTGGPGPVPTPPPNWEEAIERLPDGLKKVLQSIKQRVLTFGDDVDTYTTRANFIFKATRVFAEIPQVPKAKRTRLVIRVRPEGFNIPENETAVVDRLSVKRVPDSYLWNVNHEFEVTETTDLNAVMRLLRQSYDGARRRS